MPSDDEAREIARGLSPDPATLRAVEAAALAVADTYDALSIDEWCRDPRAAWTKCIVAGLAAYHAALGETVRVTRVERCAGMDGKEEK